MVYTDFKSYIQNEYSDYLRQVIVSFVRKMGKWTDDVRVNNLEVKSCRENNESDLGLRIEIDTEVEFFLNGCMHRKRFIIYTIVDLKNSIEKIKFVESQTKVQEGDLEDFKDSNLYDEFMIPYISSDGFEKIADEFYEFYRDKVCYSGYRFPYEQLVGRMNIDVKEVELPPSTMGRIYFKKDRLIVTERYPYLGRIEEEEIVEPGTIVISENNFFMDKLGCSTLTVAHEMVHWVCHKKFFKILSWLNHDQIAMNCYVQPKKYDDAWSNRQKAMWIAEWQANALGIRIAMPRELFEKAMREADSMARKNPYKGSCEAQIMEEKIRIVAELFDVSELIVKQRAIQLGYDMAAGTYIQANGNRYWDPFYFPQGTLKQNQTFVIDKRGLENACAKNAYLKEILVSGKYIYLGYVVCKNDRKYVEKIEDNEYGYELTEYASDHADECCLIFNWKSLYGKIDEGGFYGRCYLNKDFSADEFIEYWYDPNFKDNQKENELKEQLKKEQDIRNKKNKIIKELNEIHTLGEMLIYHMDRKNITVEQLSERSKLSETTIKKYRNNKGHPPLENLMAIFIGLNLLPDYCKIMLKVASYSLSEINEQQATYLMLIEKFSNGNIDQWNRILRIRGLNPIPNNRNQNKRVK